MRKIPTRKMSKIERFFYKLNIPEKKTDCWVWQGSKTKAGYGILTFNLKSIYAHRFSFTHFNGKLKRNQVVRHKCANPPCVNPEHLLSGTQYENIQDTKRSGKNAKWENHNFNKFKKSVILKIRKLFSTGKFSQADLCRKFKMSSANLNWIVKNKIWVGLN